MRGHVLFGFYRMRNEIKSNLGGFSIFGGYGTCLCHLFRKLHDADPMLAGETSNQVGQMPSEDPLQFLMQRRALRGGVFENSNQHLARNLHRNRTAFKELWRNNYLASPGR